MRDVRYHVLLNENAGTAHAMGLSAERLQELFERHDLAVTIDADAEVSLGERIERALAGDADIIVAAGGDGTITALASALVGTSKTLAILPLGTVNSLARDLQIPFNLEQAVAAIASGQKQKIDIGEVNGRVFLHNVVVGVIPGVAAAREHIRGRPGLSVKIGFLRHFLRRLARARRIALAIELSEGEKRVERVQAVAVASNAYDEGFGQFFARQRLDAGSLTLYVLKHFTVADFVRLTGGMLLGRWREDEALTIDSVRAVTIDSHKSSLKVMVDGEVEMLATPLRFRIRPLALSVLTPAAAIEAPTNPPQKIAGAPA